MTDIVPVPDGVHSTPFPTNADRTAGTFNPKVVAWGDSTRAQSVRDREIAEATRTNAIAAQERAATSGVSAGDALAQANRATAQADAAMGYRNTASAHATTATTQAGIATTKAGEAEASASQASVEKNLAQQAVADAAAQVGLAAEQVGLAAAQAVRAEEAAASIADGPVTSVNGKTGVVALTAADIAAAATAAEMQAGVEAGFRSLSPLRVKEAVLAHAPKTLLRDARTSNVQLTKADSGKLIDITSGTFAQTFAAAATLGAGWWCYLQNSGFSTDVYINGDFSSDTLWTKGTGWSITGGQAVAAATTSLLVAAPSPLISGKNYQLSFDAVVSSGTVRPYNGGTALGAVEISASGSYTFNFDANGSGLHFDGITSFTGAIENVVLTLLEGAEVTLLPSGGGAIDGLTSYIMYPGEVRLVQCDGVTLRTVVLNPFYKAFTKSGNFTKPPGYAGFGGLLWGGGGSGGSGSSDNPMGTGGGGAPCTPFSMPASGMTNDTQFVIGAGGGSVLNQSGASGGSSSFGSFVSSPGGSRGVIGSISGTTDGGSMTPSGELGSIPRYNGARGGRSTNGAGVKGDDSIYGGAGGGGSGTSLSGEAGLSIFGGSGGNGGTSALAPTGGAAPGGGGGGGRYSTTNSIARSGAGARGELRIWGVI